MKFILTAIILAFTLVNSADAKEGSPEQQVDALFKQLSSDKRVTAFQDFFSDSLMVAQKPSEVRAMDAQAKAAWEFYGPPASYEILQRTEIGKSLFRIKWLTKNADEVPLFWNVLFYRRNGNWEPLNISFFDDPTKASI
jgi:hypothetical protein